MLETKQLAQWRRHPNTFFVAGVDKARIVFDPKTRRVKNRYLRSITEQATWKLFASTYNAIHHQLAAENP